jgi:hypothetical protein
MNECRLAHRMVSGSIDSLAYLGRCVSLLCCLDPSLSECCRQYCLQLLPTPIVTHCMEDTIVNNNGGVGMLREKFSDQLKFLPIAAHCNTQRSFGGGLDLHISEKQSVSRFWMPSDLVKPSQKFTSAMCVEHMRVHSPQHI